MNFELLSDHALPILKTLLLGLFSLGGLWVIVNKLFQHYIEKWLESRFNERLQNLRHTQSIEMKEIEKRVSASLDRKIKLNQKEFELLPDIWGKLTEAYERASAIQSGLKSYTDISDMQDQQITSYLERLDVPKGIMEAILQSDNRQKTYQKWVDLKEIMDAKIANDLFTITLRKNSILIDTDIKSAMEDLTQLIHEKITEWDINIRDNVVPRMNDLTIKFKNNAPPLYSRIETMVHDRVWQN